MSSPFLPPAGTGFHPLLEAWFAECFGEATAPQREGWPAVASGEDVLIAAPTGSGKTLAAFLTAIDGLFRQAIAGRLRPGIQVLYVSPLKALTHDVHKNLEQPLASLTRYAFEHGHMIEEMRSAVRNGDTLASERQAILRHPPHILVTTPESLYLLLTAAKSRALLCGVHTVITDEIHAMAGNKRGSHLTLSLERLDALIAETQRRRPQRIGLSATVRPLERMAAFLTGVTPQGPRPCRIVHIPALRELDLGIEVPHRSELGAVATNDQWEERFDRLEQLANEHRTTLVFVSTRGLAERIAHRMSERLGEDAVAAHHGSLSRRIRLRAEERFKNGELRMMVATASLELGLDIGSVELVCQVGSTRMLAAAWQRIGRAGHSHGATPKGRFFALTRDDLLECAAIVRSLRRGLIDEVIIPPWPRDILAQQIVASVAAGEWDEEALYRTVRQAYPYRELPRKEFDDIVHVLSEGIATRRGRGAAYLHRDRIHRRLRGRRGARLTALTSGGAIAENAAYTVVSEPEQITVGSLDEDFAVESHAGDIILLGTTSWRIRGVETGRVRVEDAHGAPPTVPFWLGEAPGRTIELSREVAGLRRELAERLDAIAALAPGEATAARQELLQELERDCGLSQLASAQLLLYIETGARALGVAPHCEHVIAERFFDEAGGMQLVIHAPFGSRINKAWGLALRKRFCRGFDFELQASASENGLVLSLSEQHSFPLETIFAFLNSNSVRDILVQAVLQAPLFQTRWRWDAGRALALLRFSGGRKVPPHLQRMRSEDLLAAAFPMAVGCQDNHGGKDLELPDHPYVAEAMRDCLEEALDLPGLVRVLQGLEEKTIAFSARDTAAPSPFSHEILNAAPYSYLDDAPLEERRTRAVNLRRTLDPNDSSGRLDPSVVAAVCQEAAPDPVTPDEMHDLLLSLHWLPEELDQRAAGCGNLQGIQTSLLHPLASAGRVLPATLQGRRGWIATERYAVAEAAGIQFELAPAIRSLLPVAEETTAEQAATAIARGWMEFLGPATAQSLSQLLGLGSEPLFSALLQLEADGMVLRGSFLAPPVAAGDDANLEFCHRRLLARMHRRMLTQLRSEIEPVSPAVFMRFLLRWTHVEPETRLHGATGLAAVLRQLQSFEAASGAWETELLARRLHAYKPELLDELCLSGEIAWARLSPPASLLRGGEEGASDGTEGGNARETGRRRVIPSRSSPLSFFFRDDAGWLLPAAGLPAPVDGAALSAPARHVLKILQARRAAFFADLARAAEHGAASGSGEATLVKAQVEEALWELACAGLVTADGFDNLRALLDPKRRGAQGAGRSARPRHSAGRWSLVADLLPAAGEPIPADWQERAPLAERQARQLLRRYGVLFRALMERENCALPWFELLMACRRLETRGEIRGGRFVSGFHGEQFALPEAVEALRAVRKLAPLAAPITLSASDPLNLAGIVLNGERIAAQSNAHFRLGSLNDSAGVRVEEAGEWGHGSEPWSGEAPGEALGELRGGGAGAGNVLGGD